MVFFILGSHPELSAAEVAAVLGRPELKSAAKHDVLLVDEVDRPLSLLQDRLAGVVKIGHVVAEMKRWNKQEATDLFLSLLPTKTTKTPFGISVYDAGNGSLVKDLTREAKPLGLEIKNRLKEDGRTSRLVTGRDRDLSSVIVEKNHLLRDGAEFVLLATPEGILLGQTETVQNFEYWSKRDFGRPARDPKSGMLPPKVARMMVNLAGVDTGKSVLLDPFCGSGTILMEAALVGFQEVYGSDVSQKAILDSEKNLEWLDLHAKLVGAPAELLSFPFQVDLVVTEPYLGPPQTGRETNDDLRRIAQELTSLYQKTFRNIHRLMKPGSPLVAVFPVFRGAEAITSGLPGFKLTDRFLYERKGQRVARQIVRFVRV